LRIRADKIDKESSSPIGMNIERGTKVKIKSSKAIPKWARGKEGIICHQTREGGRIGKRWQGEESPEPGIWTIEVSRPELRGGYALVSLHEKYLKVLSSPKELAPTM